MSDQNASLAPVSAAPIAVEGGRLRPRNLSETVTMAQILARSGMVPKDYAGKPDAIIVAIQMGAGVGLEPMQALRNIAVINGRPSLWGDGLLAVVTAHPDFEDISELFDEAAMTATCAIKRRGRTVTARSFSQADAAKAGLWGKAGPWTQYPRRMLQMRARGFAARDAFPDALCGLAVAEESMDLRPEPEPINLDDFREQLTAAAEQPAEKPPGLEAEEVRAAAPMPEADRKAFAKELKTRKIAEGAVAVFGASDDWTTDDAEGLRSMLAKADALVADYGPPDGWAAHADQIRGEL